MARHRTARPNDLAASAALLRASLRKALGSGEPAGSRRAFSSPGQERTFLSLPARQAGEGCVSRTADVGRRNSPIIRPVSPKASVRLALPKASVRLVLLKASLRLVLLKASLRLVLLKASLRRASGSTGPFFPTEKDVGS